MAQQNKFRALTGVLAIYSGAFAAMAFQILPSDAARIAILSLTPLVAWLASPDVVASGGCPRCYAKRKKQEVTGSSFSVSQSSRASAVGDEVEVDTGWEVAEKVSIVCGKCSSARTSTTIHFIPRRLATTPGEALILVKNGSALDYVGRKRV